MEQVLQNLILALRGSGVRISISENIDAMNAARLVGYSDRQHLKDSLSAALAKSQHETEIFETCFDRFFSLDDFSGPEKDSGTPREIGPAREDSPLTQMLLSGDQAGLSISMRQAAEEIEITGIKFFTQKSLYIQRILRGMGIEGLDRDIGNLRKGNSAYSRQKATALKQARDLLFENVKNFVEQQYSLFAGSANHEILEKYLRHITLSNLEQQDFARMLVIIRKMARHLNDLHSRRRKSSKPHRRRRTSSRRRSSSRRVRKSRSFARRSRSEPSGGRRRSLERRSGSSGVRIASARSRPTSRSLRTHFARTRRS